VANAGVRGRPIAPLVLSPQERAYLARQVRRHRVARSLSERCRAIPRCADGLPSKSVAAELGLHEHTVGKWRRRFLRHPRSKRGSPAGLTIMFILRRLPRHGSIRSSAGSLNSPESRSSEVFTPLSGSSRPTFVPSSGLAQ
jgi:hypothetical protein